MAYNSDSFLFRQEKCSSKSFSIKLGTNVRKYPVLHGDLICIMEADLHTLIKIKGTLFFKTEQ